MMDLLLHWKKRPGLINNGVVIDESFFYKEFLEGRYQRLCDHTDHFRTTKADPHDNMTSIPLALLKGTGNV